MGDLNLLPEDVKIAMMGIMKLTENNTKLTLNVCFCYNSMFEMEIAINGIREDIIKKGKEINIEDFKKHLLIKEQPDLIVRTSNEIRLSNFLLFQGNCSQLVFLEENWPEINLFSFLKIIIEFQIHEYSSSMQKRFFLETDKSLYF